MRIALATLFLLVACGGPTTSSGDGTGGGSGGSGGDAPPSPDCTGRCHEGDRCTTGPLTQRCECTLHYDVNCGGAPRMEEPPWWAWTCTPLDPTTDRGDGCPFALPEAGAHCTTAGQRCEYSDDVCGWSGTAAVCTSGAWTLTEYAYPPPP